MYYLNKNYLVMSFFVYFLVACQTTKPIEIDQIPNDIVPFFQKCQGMDGGGTISISEKKSAFNSLQFDWIAKKNEFKFVATDALGMKQLELDTDFKKIKTQGRLASKIPALNFEGKFYKIDDYKIGIKRKEIVCLLNFLLPDNWLNKIIKLDSRHGVTTIEVEKEWRTVEVKFVRNDTSKIKEVCIEFAWSYYLGLSRHQFELCHKFEKNKQGTLSKDGTLLINWESDE